MQPKHSKLFFALGSITLLVTAQPMLAVETNKPATSSTTTSTKSNNAAAEAVKQVAGPEQLQPHSQEAETWRRKAPTSPPPRQFVLPKVVSYKLSNGLDVQLVEDHRVPFITVNLGFKVGTSSDPRDLLGVSEITADMLTEGTKGKKSLEIANEVDFIGGGLGASSDLDNTLVSGSSLSKYQDRLFNVLADVVLAPTFPEDELSLKKSNLIEELAMKRSEPDFLLEERFNKVAFGNHPYSSVAPTKESVAKITRQDLINFHKANFIPNQGHLVVIGDFDQAKMKELIAAKFEQGWQPGSPTVTAETTLPVQHGRKIYLVDRPGSVQSSIKIGNISIDKKDPDYFPMIVANQILGGGGNARLFLNIRENKGYTYGAYSSVGAHKQKGAFAAEAEVRSEVTAPSIQEFLYELERIRNVKVSPKELSDAKNFLTGSYQLGLETQSGLAQRLLEQRLFDLPGNYMEAYVNKVMAVTPDDIRRVARKHVDLDNVVICVVGDAKQIKPDLNFFAAVDVYDTSGKLSESGDKPTTPGS